MSHRRAYGPQRRVSDTQQAQFIAESILRREVEGRPWTWADYGIAENVQMIDLTNKTLLSLIRSLK